MWGVGDLLRIERPGPIPCPDRAAVAVDHIADVPVAEARGGELTVRCQPAAVRRASLASTRPRGRGRWAPRTLPRRALRVYLTRSKEGEAVGTLEMLMLATSKAIARTG